VKIPLKCKELFVQRRWFCTNKKNMILKEKDATRMRNSRTWILVVEQF